MSKLTTSQRNAEPSSVFAGPGRSFPIPDAGHARAALRDAPHALHSGSIDKAQEAHIDAVAKRKLYGAALKGGK